MGLAAVAAETIGRRKSGALSRVSDQVPLCANWSFVGYAPKEGGRLSANCLCELPQCCTHHIFPVCIQ